MPKKTFEDQDIEAIIRGTAKQAQDWQTTITLDEDLERWVADGNWTYLRAKILDQIELEAFSTIKNPNFDPTNFSQVAQLKALCQTIDLIEAKINQRLAMVADARAKLRDLERSTPKEE
jgi:hypothetical protein